MRLPKNRATLAASFVCVLGVVVAVTDADARGIAGNRLALLGNLMLFRRVMILALLDFLA